MIDIHHHLLYGLDDGARDLEDAVAMAHAAIENGITHVVCTPHSNDQFPFDPMVNFQKLMALKERIGDGLTLGLGCDFHLSYDNIENQFKYPTRYTINGKQYLLVEFPDMAIPLQISDTLYNFNIGGVIPIITHPERNYTLVQNPSRMAVWLRSGCLIQITAGSLLGRFGKRAESAALDLLERNWVNFIASDAHNVTSRPVVMREAYTKVARRYGQETADRLCIHNPRAVFYGEPMPPQPEPAGLEEAPPPPQGFLARLFSK
ncbi:MAG TPA: CpsB/CapC family capsule biosynthesis tyrosine phosphatase [Acidisarcina sp.]